MIIAVINTNSFLEASDRMYRQSKKKKKNLIYFNTNYRTEMKLVPVIMDYYLLQFDVLNFFLGVCLHGGGDSLSLIFSM